MARSTCACGQPAIRRGLCDAHFAERFLEQLPTRYSEDPDTGCWLWIDSLSAAGSPKVNYAGKTSLAHRVVYQLTHDVTLRPAQQLDHLCETPRCINPDHMEIVTARENMRRVYATRTDDPTPRMARSIAVGRGAIRQLRSGNWQIRVPLPRDPVTGKRRELVETLPAATGSRALELRRAELVSRASRAVASASPSRIPTVGDVLDAWLDLPRLATATRAKAVTALKHLPPALRRQRADRLTGRELDQLYRHLEQSGVGTPTIRTIHGTISAAFGQAVKWGTVDRNPAALATQPRAGRSRAEGDVTDTQIAALIDAVAHDPQQALWLRLHLTTAARRSEILAVRWSNVLDDRLAIRGALERDGTAKDTKTHQARTIALGADTAAMIRAWQRRQRERALAAGVPLAPNPYLLSHDPDSSTPWKPNSSTQLFIRLRRRAGIGDTVRLHDLRHAAASWLLASGVDVTTVAERLGHSNPRTTLTVYAHVLEGRDSAAADVLDRRLS